MAAETGLLTSRNDAALWEDYDDQKVDPGSDSCELSEWSRGLATPVRTVRLMLSIQARPCDAIQGVRRR